MSSTIFPAFFEHNDYFIDEKVGLLKFNNAYKVYNSDGIQIGNVQQSTSTGEKLLRLLLSKSMLPFRLDIKDTEGVVLATIKRGWTLFMSKIHVLDANGVEIASIKQKFKFFKPTFLILDPAGAQIGKISGDWKAWNFTIADNADRPIGTITKKWNGILKEALTTADKYVVSIQPNVVDQAKKIILVATSITIDMVLKESA
ncbi:MAG: hypothetical protein LBQ65_04320 [Tannerellaceae bacterium]|jgi:uncharacterized protein YxjI|nr:hypothetical protein [Tannerellaceae bacterium]